MEGGSRERGIPGDSGPPPAAAAGLRNVKLTVEYEGTRYHGWQRQDDRPTVQGELERAIGRVVDHPVTLYGSGRTDRGVHALGQVANFLTPKAIPGEKLLLGVNTYLPDDIRILAVEDAAPDFHARYSARGKRYRYTILRSRVERVMLRAGCAVLPTPLDVEAMRRGAAAIRGFRDFRAFEGNIKRRARPPDEPRSTVRTVRAVNVREAGPLVCIDAFGKGFLYGMVRAIAGTLIEIGWGRRSPEDVEPIIASLDRRAAGFTAPARGLCLVSVYYSEEDLERAAEASEKGMETPCGTDGIDMLKLFLGG